MIKKNCRPKISLDCPFNRKTVKFSVQKLSTCWVSWVRAGLHLIVTPEVGGELSLTGEQLAAQRALEVREQQ